MDALRFDQPDFSPADPESAVLDDEQLKRAQQEGEAA